MFTILCKFKLMWRGDWLIMKLKVLLLAILTIVGFSISGCGYSDANSKDDGGGVANSAPVAKAGRNRDVKIGSFVILDGSASSDSDGDTLTYKWSIKQKPAGSTASLSNASSVNPTFIADKDGAYSIQLIVNDGKVDSKADYVSITATAKGINSAPYANAGIDQNIKTGMVATLDGSESNDADGDTLTFKWAIISKPAGSTAVLSDPTSPNPTFTADMDGVYKVRLIVNDGTVDSLADFVKVIATPGPVNAVPVANAGPDQNVKEGDFVILDGTASYDADGDALTYEWSFVSDPSGGNSPLSSTTSARPTFTPNVAGTYVVRLSVNDGNGGISVADYVSIIVTSGSVNAIPVANAGPDQNVKKGDFVVLDGTASSDADGDTLTYAWSISSRPGGSTVGLSDNTSARPTFKPDRVGTFVIKLVVNDGTENSVADYVTVAAADVAGNSAPVADAGRDQNVKTGTRVTLDGSGSTDTDGDDLTYTWQIVDKPGGSSATLDGKYTIYPRFTADVEGKYVIQLTVNDGTEDSVVDQVVVTATVDTDNAIPIADAGADVGVAVGNLVTLSGENSTDADGDILTYRWSLVYKPSGSGSALADQDTKFPRLRPDVVGQYVIQLIVNDGTVDSEADQVVVTAHN